MSPEQARGLAVDTRSDVWAFACVLYELLTRRAVFNGNTVTDVLAAVVNGEPDWSLLPTDTPVAIQRLLRRALEKDHKRRLRHIGDARLAIEDALAAPATVKQPAAARNRWLVLPWLAAAAGLSAAGWFAVTRGDREVDRLASLQVARLTSDAGLTTMPAVSRDGRLIAYTSDRAGRGDLDIWVQLAEGSPLRLTDDPADDLSPHFSPDGNQVAFRSERAGGGVYVVATLGGKPRLIGPEGRNPQFSPDGSRIAYWSGSVRGGSTAVSSTYVTPLGGGERVRLLTEFETARDPVWAPDGRSLLVAALASDPKDATKARCTASAGCVASAPRRESVARARESRGMAFPLYIPEMGVIVPVVLSSFWSTVLLPSDLSTVTPVPPFC
jgi:dipeptidyl aminopeptidase/acylaminoacyl peptidase